MVISELSLVVKVPVLLSPDGPVVEDAPVKLKQYKTLDVKSELAKVTVCPETVVAVDPIPGQEVEPDGRFDTLVVKFDAVWETVKSLGKVITILFSVPAPGDDGSMQTVPDKAEFAA